MNQTQPAAQPIVLVTGGTGFLGSRVARRLVDMGRRVRAIVRAKGTAPELDDPRIEEVEGDFVDPRVIQQAMPGVDSVVHCAASPGPDLDTARRVNAGGTRGLVEGVLLAAVRRYVHISTLSVYAPTKGERVDEDAPLKETGDPYGLTKAEADRVVLDAMNRGLRATILRPGAILGVHRTSTWGVRIPARVRDRQIKLKGDGREIMPWVHVDDLVDAVLLALDDDHAVGRVYNVADHHVSWRDFTDEVRGWFGTAPLDITPEAEFGSYWMGRYEAARIRAELGYRPRRTYEQGMAEAADYWSHEGAPKH